MRTHWKPRRPRYSLQQREAIYRRCKGKCAYCGRSIPLKSMEVDHVVPYSYVRHGYLNVNITKNFLPACRVCNELKASLSVEAFRVKISQLVTAQGEGPGLPSRYGENSVAFQGWNHDRRFWFEKLRIKIPQFSIEKRTKKKGDSSRQIACHSS